MQVDGLGELVDATRGPQPYRRLFHAAVGTCTATLVWVVDPYPMTAIVVLTLVLVVLLAMDLARLGVPALNALFFRVFKPLASPREAGGFASSTWYVLGILLAVLLFPENAVVPAILVLAVADPAASYLGRRWGTRKVGAGSPEGLAVFVVTATAVLSFWVSPARALIAAAAGGLVEIVPWRLDDNLTIPLTVATVLWLLGVT